MHYLHTLRFESTEEAFAARKWIEDSTIKGEAYFNNSTIPVRVFLHTDHFLNLRSIQYLQRGAKPNTITVNEEVAE